MQTIYPQEPLKTLRECEGYYRCPKGPGGKRLGPLVGYAGKYDSGNGVMKAYVGEVYYNFSAAEEEPFVLHHFGGLLSSKIKEANIETDAVLGAPMGGILLAGSLGFAMGGRILFAEKKITAVATEGQREQSVLSLERHQVHKGERVVVVEDVCNNFSTTQQLLELVSRTGGSMVAIACFLNRSSESAFGGECTRSIPVVSVIHVPTQQWRQDDPEVAEDVQSNNVAWKPKIEWSRLKAAMEEYSPNKV